MDASTVTQIDEKRKRRALILAAQGHVTPRFATYEPSQQHAHQFRVTSQTTPDVEYIVTDVLVDPNHPDHFMGSCNCPDKQKHPGSGFACKHIAAAAYLRTAAKTCLKIAKDHDMPMSQVLYQIEMQRAPGNRPWDFQVCLDILAQAARILTRISRGKPARNGE